MKKILKQKKYILIGGTALFLLAGVVVYIILFQSLRTTFVQSSIETYETQEALDEFYAVNSQRRAIDTTQDDRLRVDEYFIQEDSVARFFESLENMASDAEVQFNVASAQVREEDPAGLQLNLRAGGAFNSVYQFTGLLETMGFGVHVNTYTLQYAERAQSDIPSDVVVGPWVGTYDIVITSYLES